MEFVAWVSLNFWSFSNGNGIYTRFWMFFDDPIPVDQLEPVMKKNNGISNESNVIKVNFRIELITILRIIIQMKSFKNDCVQNFPRIITRSDFPGRKFFLFGVNFKWLCFFQSIHSPTVIAVVSCLLFFNSLINTFFFLWKNGIVLNSKQIAVYLWFWWLENNDNIEKYQQINTLFL